VRIKTITASIPSLTPEQNSDKIEKFGRRPCVTASFVRVCVGDSIDTTANATSQAFYVIRGRGSTSSEHGTISWGTGDLFVVPVGLATYYPSRHRHSFEPWCELSRERETMTLPHV
jgi:mannose-6-phosphate isomerase-like protein (cupin superfamily)